MRLGGPVLDKTGSPDEWISALKKHGYRSAFCPLAPGASSAEVSAYREAAKKADIVIAEVGVWNNPLDPDPAKRKVARDDCKAALALAEEIGAKCCVNCAGTFHPGHWYGPHPDNLADRGIEAVAEACRDIIDAVKPKRTVYSLEPMGFILPDSVDAYEAIIKAVDRAGFGVHYDPVNLVNTPHRYFKQADLIREFVGRLGKHIRSCHVKDIMLQTDLTVYLKEVRAGLGQFDHVTFFREIERLDPEMPVLLEHLNTAEDYRLAGEFVRGKMREAGIPGA